MYSGKIAVPPGGGGICKIRQFILGSQNTVFKKIIIVLNKKKKQQNKLNFL
jgi:hypothetical protein